MLIVYLSPQPTALFDYVDSVDGRSVSRSGQALAKDLVRFGSEVVAVVPWQVLAWHSVSLPPNVGGRLNAVLGSLLEDSCLQDPHDLHLVLSPLATSRLRQGGQTMVAACAKDWLRTALAPLVAAGLRIQNLAPEVCPSPKSDAAQLHVLNDGAKVQALLCRHDSVWRLPPAAALAAWAPVANKTLWAEPSVADDAAGLSDLPAYLQTPQQRWLQASGNDWDLAQGEWAQSRGLRGWRWLQAAWRSLRFDPAWQATRRGLMLLLLVNVLGLNLWAWRIQAEVAQQRQNLQQILTSTFPKVKLVIDAPTQMRREVQALQKNSAQAQDSDVDVMLQALSGPWPAGAVPTQIDYRGGALRLTGLKPEALEALQQTYASHARYRLEVQGSQVVLQAKEQP
jgi:general secretion pathway protein L